MSKTQSIESKGPRTPVKGPGPSNITDLQPDPAQAALHAPMIPLFHLVSGSYESKSPILWQPLPLIPNLPLQPIPTPPIGPIPDPIPFAMEDEGEEDALHFPIVPSLFQTELLKLDVDGYFPQQTASGTLKNFFGAQVHWVAKLKKVAANRWAGPIWYKNGTTATLPQTKVDITVSSSIFSPSKTLVARFTGGGATRTRTFKRVSTAFHSVEFEFDCATGVVPTTSINTHAHPNRPGTLPSENLSIQDVFTRAGFQVKKSGGDNIIPLTGAGANLKWSDSEMHDAMQTYWSRFANKPQWSLWTFFASLHESGTSLGGIMFDDIGPNHRQGTALFNDSFIKNAPAGDAAPAAWVRRMKFWTAVHEMGHAFNLAHSWQKALGAGWIPLANENEARSFMNYPYNVSGGQTAFFKNFGFRFSNGELLFMRHAPERFVQMGNAAWFDNHGFEQVESQVETDFELEIRTNRGAEAFEYLEPAVIELKLKNVSGRPQIINANALSDLGEVLLVIKRQGAEARIHRPFAAYCREEEPKVLQHGAAIYESAFVGADLNGWNLSEPGTYTLQAMMQINDQNVVSRPFEVRVRPPHNHDEECVAQDMFGGQLGSDVGRVLQFDGSLVLNRAVDVLRDVAQRLPKSQAAVHAGVSIACTDGLKRNSLAFAEEEDEARGSIQLTKGDEKTGRAEFGEALTKDMNRSARALGHIDFNYYVQNYATWLAERGDAATAKAVVEELKSVLKKRGVLPSVLEDISAKASQLGK